MTGSDDLRYHGTELVLLYDYKAQGKNYYSLPANVVKVNLIQQNLQLQTIYRWNAVTGFTPI